MSPFEYGILAVSGVAAHVFYFHQNERHLYPWKYVQAYLVALLTAAFLLFYAISTPWYSALTIAANYTAIHLAGLYSSLVIFRLFLTPLNRMPGPYLARLSKSFFSLSCRGLDGHRQLLTLHKKYGQYVRLGPNDISVIDPEGVQVVEGSSSKCIKSPAYDVEFPLTALISIRAKAAHERYRRTWGLAFSEKAMRNYEERIAKTHELLSQKIQASLGKPINMSLWFNYWSYDVMGDLGLGTSFDMLQNEDARWVFQALSNNIDVFGLHLPPWVFRAVLAILPAALNPQLKFNTYCNEQLQSRMNMKNVENRDVAGALIDNYIKNPSPAGLNQLRADTRILVVAGSDTTAATMTCLFYELARDPALLSRLRDEVDPLKRSQGGFEHQSLQHLPLLNATINETLRLHPPVPSGLERKTPTEGIMIGDRFVPGNTIVQLPQYVMAREESIYTNCASFCPERWFSKPEMIKHKEAFAPFSLGSYSCIGKNLALMEIRTLTAQLIDLFDVALAPNETGQRLLEESTAHVTMGLGSLDLVFTVRER